MALSLLMWSNVLALVAASSTGLDLVSSSNLDLVSASNSAADSKAEVEAILQLQFAEPLPKVLKRAQKASKTMHIDEALKTVGHKMDKDITGLLQNDATQGSKLRMSGNALVHQAPAGGGLAKASVFDRAMAFINAEYKIVREELDLKLLECGFFKLQKEGLLFETQDKLDELAMDMGLAEATMNACQAEIAKQNAIIEVKLAELFKITTWCKIVHDELFAIKSAAEEDLRVINLILSVAKEECAKMAANSFMQVHACLGPDGLTHFKAEGDFIQKHADKLTQKSSQQAFQRMLFELYGVDQALPGKLNLQALDEFDDDDSEDFPAALMEAEGTISVEGTSFIQVGAAPDAGTDNSASNDAQRERCSGVAAKPRCQNILDKLGQMQGELIDALAIATQNLQQHDTECQIEIDGINAEIQACRDIVATQTEQFDRTSAFHNGMAIEHNQESTFKRALCKEIRIKYTECYKKCKDLEREMCGLLKIRQAVYNKVKNPDGKKPQLMIQDCMMTDWVVGECSGTCLDPNGNSGIQIIKREPLEGWDNTTEEGKYGASCPPDEVDRDCANVPCPIDCIMKPWSAWSECTAQCGGGSETRTRGVLTPDDHGGAKCPSNSESDACNTQACDKDCVLADWSGWTPCTKSCLPKWNARPGLQYRTKGIKEPTIGNGLCPKPHKKHNNARWEKQKCNTFICPKTIECISNLDVVFVQDGSGSLWYRWGGRSKWDRNFELSKKFMLKMVEMSNLAKVNEFEQVGDGLRFGVVLYAFSARIMTQITNDKAVLKDKIGAMKWPMGGTMTGRALNRAKTLFPLAAGGKTRLQVIVLITDGRASNRAWAFAAAKSVKDSGIRMVLIPVKGALRNPSDMCKMAGSPCADNMINTPRWTMLMSRLTQYLVTFCPTVVDPSLK